MSLNKFIDYGRYIFKKKNCVLFLYWYRYVESGSGFHIFFFIRQRILSETNRIPFIYILSYYKLGNQPTFVVDVADCPQAGSSAGLADWHRPPSRVQ